jgi:hypothetical protein
MQIPPRISPQRFDMAVVAFGLAAEKLASARCGSLIKAARGRLRRGYRELIKLKRLKLCRD